MHRWCWTECGASQWSPAVALFHQLICQHKALSLSLFLCFSLSLPLCVKLFSFMHFIPLLFCDDSIFAVWSGQCRSMSVGGVTFPLEQQSKDPQSVVYTGLYETEGVAHTKSGERQPVQVSIQVWIHCAQHRGGRTVLVCLGIMFWYELVKKPDEELPCSQ